MNSGPLLDRRFILAAGVALLAGCATPTPRVIAPPGSALSELEPIYLADAQRDRLTIRVSSNGCTTKGDFAFHLERRGQAVALAFGRRRLDTCRTVAPGHADLSFTWAELGVPPRTPVFLLNPLEPWGGP